MDVNGVNNQGSIEAFQRLVMNARMRNGGFNLPVGKATDVRSAIKIDTENIKKPAFEAHSAAMGAINKAKGLQTEGGKMLGTRFDAYA
jgi:hypothetical protein